MDEYFSSREMKSGSDKTTVTNMNGMIKTLYVRNEASEAQVMRYLHEKYGACITLPSGTKQESVQMAKVKSEDVS